ncbi:geranylgeranyl diphosphate synthase type II [Mucilaginibacter frigoritolerans]|uniref:Geranylgeranyl diphosphate synthase type II n=1 Tax=Mucilaginibacter frigoritolerans TaxID=652788 RepID=A0A562TXA1_9SPHI|nr:polyprenyl synthetase family protein [Mucilaginibacter frigoritolerans]TWI98195.1 geranylgeranyl diphosphate synthase type II [Mucilaginibacter frigoritolerans]
MKKLEDLQAIISNAVDNLAFPDHPAELYEPINYILSLGGKRMRPALLLMACDLFGGDIDAALPPALAIEVFHNFTLMHDDIMDNAPLRRGQVTVHEKWNNNVGILSGDVMLVQGYKLMMQVEDHLLRPILDIFNTTAVGVCEGQQLDMDFEQRDNVGIDEYLEMIRLKTAVVLGGALKIGALIGGADVKDADLLSSFGEHLGIAFQLQDDILDVYGDPEKFGKQVGGDIISNKKTYLLIKALELAGNQHKTALDKWIALKQFDNAEKVAAVTAIYNSLNIRQYAEEAMQKHTDKAFEALDAINLPAAQKQYLHDFADGLLVREN